MEKLLIRGGLVTDPKNGREEKADVLVADGRIFRVAPGLSAEGARVIDASNLVVAPGLVDLHVHFREPGYEYKEDIESGSRAASRGGVTSVVCMPNTAPPVDNAALVKYVTERGWEVGLTHVYTVGCITKGMQGEELSEMGELRRAGAVGVSDDGRPVRSSGLMRRALEYSKMFHLPVFSHCEDLELVDGGSMNEGAVSALLGLRGIPKAAESVAVARDVLLAEEMEARLHVCHVSTRASIDCVRRAKARGARITCETAPHYFALTEEAVQGFDTNAKMNPPLREKQDVEAVIEGLKDGTIDAIATDHAPHHIDEKNVEFELAQNGIIGLETSLSLGITHLVRSGALTLSGLIEKMSLAPARILGIAAGSLSEGAPADIVIFDPEREYTVDVSRFASKSKNAPYDGMRLFGVVRYTVLDGRVVFDRAAEEGEA